jgi:UDP-N-acetylmuramoyl-tripeptide--D-alanyl-D-alanine ligase
MIFFELDNLCSTLTSGAGGSGASSGGGGRVLHKPSRPLVLQGVGIDSREDLSRKVFFAIKGGRHDGHDFLHDAIVGGAQLLVVERDPQLPSYPPLVGVVQVDDTRKVLGRLAAAYRKTLRGTQVIAVVGSAGKTTTKRLIDAALRGSMHGSISPKSFNNDIGVPLTLLNAPSTDRYVVVEIGTNSIGEVPHLAKMVQPDIAVITMIGREHLEGLGSLENIAAENAAVLTHLQPKGFAVINADAPLLRSYAKIPASSILFGESDDAEMRLTARGVNESGGGWWFEINGRTRYQFSLPGKHNAINAVAAVAVARRLGVQDQQISEGLSHAEAAPMRMTMQRIGEVTIHNDAYNANPDSMIAALETFAEVAGNAPRRIIVIGDMLELGDAGPALHREVIERIFEIDRAARLDRVFTIGKLSGLAADVLRERWDRQRVMSFETVNAASGQAIAAALQPGDAVLLKGSRSIGLERLLAYVEERLLKPVDHQPPGSPPKGKARAHASKAKKQAI